MSGLSEKLFVAIEQYESVSEAIKANKNANIRANRQKLSISQIVDVVLNPTKSANKDCLMVINQHLQYRRLYKQLINNSYAYYCPKQVAASTEETILTRRADAFELSVVTSDNYDDNDIQIVLSFDDDSHTLRDTANIHCFYQDSIFPLVLDQIAAKKYSAIISARDAIYMALSHNDCEIFIR